MMKGDLKLRLKFIIVLTIHCLCIKVDSVSLLLIKYLVTSQKRGQKAWEKQKIWCKAGKKYLLSVILPMQKMSHNSCGYLSTPDVWAVIPQWLEKGFRGLILYCWTNADTYWFWRRCWHFFSYAHTKGPNQWQVASSEAQHLGI